MEEPKPAPVEPDEMATEPAVGSAPPTNARPTVPPAESESHESTEEVVAAPGDGLVETEPAAESKPEDETKPEVEDQAAHQPAPPKPPKAPRGDGVNSAIIATVVIVLGLAVLAVYAYIKTK